MADPGGGMVPPLSPRNLPLHTEERPERSPGGSLDRTLTEEDLCPNLEGEVVKTTVERPIILYRDKDNGPYIVFVETNESVNRVVNQFNHLKIARDIATLNIKNIKNMKSKGSSRVAIEFLDYRAS